MTEGTDSNGGLHVAVVGATGVVGKETISILGERAFPIRKLSALASKRSIGKSVEFNGTDISVDPLDKDSFKGVDVAFFAAGSSVSKEFIPVAVKAGAVVIDKSSLFRMSPEVPLIVPEVNSNTLREFARDKVDTGFVVATPNCTTIPLVVVLNPIIKRVGIKRVVVSTYQAVSGAGKGGIDELITQVTSLFNQREIESKVFSHRIAFNCIPQIDSFCDNGYTKEEMKVIDESRKILEIPDLKITTTAVRVPVFTSHSESVNIELADELSADDARRLLRESPGILVADSPEDNVYPMATDVSGTDATFVGRIRKDESVPHGLSLWIVADNLRKGAALNAVQIAESLLGERFPQLHTLQ